MQHNTARPKVYFEVTNACNFRCGFCPIHVSSRKPQVMDYALFRTGVDQIVQGRLADTVGFHVLGEPLLYPHILDAVEYAHTRGLRTVLTTNGSLLTPDIVLGLAAAGLSALIISLQMLGTEAHRCRGTTLSFEAYYRSVVAAVRQLWCSSRDTQVQIVTMSTWSRRFFDLDRDVGIEANSSGFHPRLALLFGDLYRAVGRPLPSGRLERAVKRVGGPGAWHLRVDERVSVSIVPFIDWGNAFTSRRIYPARFGYCSYALNNIGVLSNGAVTICCGDYDGRASLGNLRERPLGLLLSSEPAQAIRDGLDHMRLVHPHCQRCFGSTNPAKAGLKGLASICLFKLAGLRPGGEQKLRTLLPDDMDRRREGFWAPGTNRVTEPTWD